MNVDYVIVGQGICGTFLSYELMQAGKTVLVIDENGPYTSTKAASGVINPITGRRMVRTWEIEKLMPYAVNAYRTFGEKLAIPLIRQCNILDFHPTPQMALAFTERQQIEKELLRIPDYADQWKIYFNYDFTIGEIDPCWLIDLNALLAGWRLQLQKQESLMEDVFIWDECAVTDDHITYRNITAQKIIFCDGVAGFENPYFRQLPYSRNKGQALIVHIPGLPRTNIFKQGINIVPWQDDLFWIVSTYEWNFTDCKPSSGFRIKTEFQLRNWLRLSFEVADHIAAERPANMERRPFVGLHPLTPSVGIFNGMGTKGCSLSPYFAREFAGLLLHDTPLTPEADIRRFSKILSR